MLNHKFVFNLNDDFIDDVAQLLDFHDGDGPYIDRPDLYRLIHGASNIMIIEAKANGKQRIEIAIESIIKVARDHYPYFDLSHGCTYMFQIVVGSDAQLFMWEFKKVYDWAFSYQKEGYCVFGVSSNPNLGNSIILRFFVNNLKISENNCIDDIKLIELSTKPISKLQE